MRTKAVARQYVIYSFLHERRCGFYNLSGGLCSYWRKNVAGLNLG